MKETIQPELVVEQRTALGEGAIWDASAQRLYWVNILGSEVYAYDPKTGDNRAINTGEPVGTVVPRASGGLTLALQSGFAHLDLATEEVTPIADPESDIPANRFNDGKCDPAGRFWAGTMDFDGAPDRGALYCLDTHNTVTRKLSPVTISNGIVWSADNRTLYFIDTALNNVRAWDFDIDTGNIENERVAVVNEGDGNFDGMSIDAEGMLWIAMWEGWGVRRYDPQNGTLLRDVRLPFEKVTSCAFGGKNLDELYITSACYQLSVEAHSAQPLAGSLVKIDPGVPGVPASAFGG